VNEGWVLFLVLRQLLFAFVLWSVQCSVSFHSFLLRHLAIAPVRNTKKLTKFLSNLGDLISGREKKPTVDN